MEFEEYEFKIITPIFSYGNNEIPEIRPASIKGMMRYMFRIAQPTLKTSDLLKHENKLFGDAESKASPIRLAIVSKPKADTDDSQFLHHKDSKTGEFRKKFKSVAFSQGQNFTVRMMLRPKHLRDLEYLNNLKEKQYECLSVEEQKDFDRLNIEIKDACWYKSLLELSFLFIGIGQRSRKGRGRAGNEKKKLKDIKGTKDDILILLNEISGELYQFDDKDEKIIPCKSKKLDRPVINEIKFGKVIEKQGNNEPWQVLLEKIDEASHCIKNRDNQVPEYASLVEKRTNRNGKNYHETYYATGSITEPWCRNKRKRECKNRCICDYRTVSRFSSSIIVGAVETTDGLLPVYTCVTAIVKGKLLDAEEEWKKFIDFAEEMEVDRRG